MQHQPRKRFGQNFLTDESVIDAIVRAFSPNPDETVVEIGPGQGALTHRLLKTLNHLTAIEIDWDLQAFLRTKFGEKQLTLIGADALSLDYSTFGKNIRLIGNLPYNISTPLLIHLLKQVSLFQDMTFMFQKEVALRIAAVPGSKAYGRLSVMAQSLCEITPLLDVSSDAFYPKPKVESAVIQLKPYSLAPAVDFASLEAVVAKAFQMRRKTVFNNLKSCLSRDDLIQLGLDPGARPEQLAVSDYVKIAKFLTK